MNIDKITYRCKVLRINHTFYRVLDSDGEVLHVSECEADAQAWINAKNA